MFPNGRGDFACCRLLGFLSSQRAREKIMTVLNELFEGRFSVALRLSSRFLFRLFPSIFRSSLSFLRLFLSLLCLFPVLHCLQVKRFVIDWVSHLSQDEGDIRVLRSFALTCLMSVGISGNVFIRNPEHHPSLALTIPVTLHIRADVVSHYVDIFNSNSK